MDLQILMISLFCALQPSYTMNLFDQIYEVQFTLFIWGREKTKYDFIKSNYVQH
jgi:hypothetical protein